MQIMILHIAIIKNQQQLTFLLLLVWQINIAPSNSVTLNTMESNFAPMWSQKQPNACKSQEHRDEHPPSLSPSGSARMDPQILTRILQDPWAIIRITQTHMHRFIK